MPQSKGPIYSSSCKRYWHCQVESAGSRESNSRRYPQRLCTCHHSKSWLGLPPRAGPMWWTLRKFQMGRAGPTMAPKARPIAISRMQNGSYIHDTPGAHGTQFRAGVTGRRGLAKTMNKLNYASKPMWMKHIIVHCEPEQLRTRRTSNAIVQTVQRRSQRGERALHAIDCG